MFQKLCQTRHASEVWSDFINIVSISIRASIDLTFRDALDEHYSSIIRKYSAQEFDQFAQLFAQLVLIIEENPWQDFLGEFYMEQNLNGETKGQFFTPYVIAHFMAEMTISKDAKNDCPISINDPACGSGVMLISAAEVWSKKENRDYKRDLFFVGQDIDPLVAKMCYIQLSLLGCRGFVKIGNSLTDPIVTPIKHSIDIWPTPMFFLL